MRPIIRRDAAGTAGGSDPSQPAQVPAAAPYRRGAGRWLTRYAVVFITIALGLVFAATNPSTFPTVANFQVVAGANSVTLLLALASLPPLIGGDFDLSVGYILELASVLVAVLVGRDHLNAAFVIAATILIGALIGLVNGILITRVGISSFIATIGIGSVLAGISIYLTGGTVLIQGIPRGLQTFAQSNTAGIPNVVWLAAVITLIFWITFEQTPYGRKLLAIGLSRRSADLLGMRVNALRTSSFVISGTLSAVAGVVELGRVGSASSGVGPSFLLPAVAAGFLGATTIKVGRFNVLGTVVAVILVAIGVSGLELNGVPNWVEPVFDGGVLVLAVGFSRLAAARRP
jgi:ribose transport system permease protein